MFPTNSSISTASSDIPSTPRIRVALVVCGLPLPKRPFNGLHNLRTISALTPLVDLRVIYLRAWTPRRRIWNLTFQDGVPILTLAVPQIPRCWPLNSLLYRMLGWPLVRSYLNECDLIHSDNAAMCGTIASSWARWMGLPHVTQPIGSDVNVQLPRAHRHPLLRGWERSLRTVICDSKELEAAFRKLYPFVPNVSTVYRGVDLTFYQPQGPVLGPLAARPPVRFLFLGGFPPFPGTPYRSNTKGGETLLRAWSMAESDLIKTDASLLVAGPFANSKRVQKWRGALQHPERVYLAGPLAPNDVPAYLRSADAVLTPSMQDGLPQVALEAAACGRAVLGSDLGGIPEVVVHQQTGCLLPAGDVEAWSRALITYAALPDSLRAMGERARTHIEASFDARAYGSKLMAIYSAILFHQPPTVPRRDSREHTVSDKVGRE